MKTNKLLLSLLTVGMFAGLSARGAIVVEQFDTFNTGDLPTGAPAQSFTVNNVADSYLIVGTSGSIGQTGVSVNGNAMTEVFSASNTAGAVRFFAYDMDSLDLSGGAVDLLGTGTGGDHAWSAFQLSGVPTAQFVTGSGSASTLDLRWTLDSAPSSASFIFAQSVMDRNYGGLQGIKDESTGSFASMAGGATGDDVNNHGIGYGYFNDTGATFDGSTRFYSEHGGGGGGGVSHIGGAISVVAIPEPGALALMGIAMGAVVIGLRSRK